MHTIECMRLELHAIAHDRMHAFGIARDCTGVNKPASFMFFDYYNGKSACIIVPQSLRNHRATDWYLVACHFCTASRWQQLYSFFPCISLGGMQLIAFQTHALPHLPGPSTHSYPCCDCCTELQVRVLLYLHRDPSLFVVLRMQN